MPMRAGPPGGDEVEDLVAVGVEQRGALGAREHDRLALGAMLGEGMPDMAPVARQHLLGKRGGATARAISDRRSCGGSCELGEIELGLDGPAAWPASPDRAKGSRR